MSDCREIYKCHDNDSFVRFNSLGYNRVLYANLTGDVMECISDVDLNNSNSECRRDGMYYNCFTLIVFTDISQGLFICGY